MCKRRRRLLTIFSFITILHAILVYVFLFIWNFLLGDGSHNLLERWFKGHQSTDVCTKKCYLEFYFIVVAFVLVFSVVIVFAYFLVYLAKYNLLEPHFFLGIAVLLHSFFFL